MEIKVDNLGTIIRYERLNKGMTQAELAKQSSISVSAISKMENGKRLPSMQTAIDIFRALGVRLEATNY